MPRNYRLALKAIMPHKITTLILFAFKNIFTTATLSCNSAKYQPANTFAITERMTSFTI